VDPGEKGLTQTVPIARETGGGFAETAARLIRDVESFPTWRDLGRTESPVYDSNFFRKEVPAKVAAKKIAAKAETDSDMKKFLEAAKVFNYSVGVWFDEKHYDRLNLAFKTYGLEATVAAFRKLDSQISEDDWMRGADLFAADIGKWVEGVRQEDLAAAKIALG
jgi:hypothetical protein